MSDDVFYFDHYEPDYKSTCICCGSSPTVLAVDDAGKVVCETEMCGPCTWGEARTIAPDTWNEDVSDERRTT